MKETNGIPIITLYGCPHWAHATTKNNVWEDNATLLDKAPTPSHYTKFAHLCAEVARRYPDVKYYQVWNGLKGFWNSTEKMGY